MNEPHPVIRNLRRVLNNDADLTRRLLQSLRTAHCAAQARLDPELFAALDWPQSIADYEDYLHRFLRWVPAETGAPAWARAAPRRDGAREITDRLAHFFWLIDQRVDDDRQPVVQRSPAFAGWLTEFSRVWGDVLDTPESFSPQILRSFIDNAPEYRLRESLIDGVPNMPSGWLTFNQFIARELNAGLRPIASRGDNRVVTSPADCFFRQRFDIGADSSVPAVTVKQTQTYGNIATLLAGSFAGGTFVHYLLPACAYHRFHLPVTGRIAESFLIHDAVFLQVGIEGHRLVARGDTESGYQFFHNRGVVVIDTSTSDAGDIGLVAVVCVGMSHVGSVALTAGANTRPAKGDQFGYFQFGGSDIIVLFQRGVVVQVDTGSGYRLVGSPIARCRPFRPAAG